MVKGGVIVDEDYILMRKIKAGDENAMSAFV